MKEIKGFQGEYRWLSNFWPVDIEYQGNVYPSVGNAYQAAKFPKEERFPFVTCTAAVAKKLGSKKKNIDERWDGIKLFVMHELNSKKYEDPVLKEKLKATGDAYIEETNNWGDTYWGVCNGEGKNYLGQILMDIRNGLKWRP
jgi:ribA/ribD-fused uncharacterized protein